MEKMTVLEWVEIAGAAAVLTYAYYEMQKREMNMKTADALTVLALLGGAATFIVRKDWIKEKLRA